MKSNSYLLIGSVVFLIVAGFCVYYFYPTSKGNSEAALALGAVVLVGLALVVVLMAALVIVYQVLGLANQNQALALPEGSVRALIAFSLVLVFVCLAAFLYNSVNSLELSPAGKFEKITGAELNDLLKTQFVVVYEPRKDEPLYEPQTDASGKPVMKDDKPVDDKTKPLYMGTYYLKRNKDADDFAKQIFTTLATIFVSVISFYFGSSATASGVGIGAGTKGSDGGKKGDPQSALDDAKVSAHDAQSAADRAAAAVKSAQQLADATTDPNKQPAAQDNAKKAKAAQDAAMQAASDANQQVQAATKAVADVTAAGSDATKASTAAADAVKARDEAKALADKAKRSADEAELLLKNIKSDAGKA